MLVEGVVILAGVVRGFRVYPFGSGGAASVRLGVEAEAGETFGCLAGSLGV